MQQREVLRNFTLVDFFLKQEYSWLMARNVFLLQTKNTILYSEALIYSIMFMLFIVALYLVMYREAPSHIFMPFMVFSVYYMFLYRPMLKEWSTSGFNSITVDTSTREIIFDKNTKLTFDEIERVRIDLEERPRMCWFLTLGLQYHALVNGEIFFKHNDGNETVVSIQLKGEVGKLKKLMHSIGLPCRVQGEEFLNEKIPNLMWFIFIFVCIAGYILNSFFNYVSNL